MTRFHTRTTRANNCQICIRWFNMWRVMREGNGEPAPFPFIPDRKVDRMMEQEGCAWYELGDIPPPLGDLSFYSCSPSMTCRLNLHWHDLDYSIPSEIWYKVVQPGRTFLFLLPIVKQNLLKYYINQHHQQNTTTVTSSYTTKLPPAT